MSGRPDPAFWEGKKVAVTDGAGLVGEPVMRRSASSELMRPRSARPTTTSAMPAPLPYGSLMMGANVFEACRELGLTKLVAACSVCTPG